MDYPIYRCWGCGKTFNERTGTPWNFIELPTDIIFQVVYFRHRFKLSYRDIAEMEFVSLSQVREQIQSRVAQLKEMMKAA